MVERFRVTSSHGVELQGYDFGGTGPTLLLCHATGFCGYVWEPVISRLQSHFRCVGFDFRGHGRSTSPMDDDMAWSGMARDLLVVVDHVSPHEPVRAVGHSLGGAAIVLAETARPGTFHSAWTYEPILFAGPGPDEDPAEPDRSEMSQRARSRRAVFPSRDDAYQRYRTRTPLSLLDDRCLRAYVEHALCDRADGSVELCCSPEREARVYERHRSGAGELVSSLTIPFAMGVGGQEDVPAQVVVEIASAHPALELIRYPQLTHFGPLQDPDGIADDIGRWFETPSSRPVEQPTG